MGWVSERKVKGSPNRGDSVADAWSTKQIVGIYGQDGSGYEDIYSATESEGNPPAAPSNNFGFERPEAPWSDDIPADIGGTNRFIWRCRRRIEGAPEVGDQVEADWGPVRLHTVYGRSGLDGLGFEYIYSATSQEDISPTLPSNDWGFDEPQAPWTDAQNRPSPVAERPFIWESRREIRGEPDVGAAIGPVWSTPILITFPTEGQRGVAGTLFLDGRGAPGANLGEDNYVYLDQLTNTLYRKDAGAWVELVTFSGVDGATWLTGTRVPRSGEGKVGDWFFSTGTNTIYQKTEVSVWTSIFSFPAVATIIAGSGPPDVELGNVNDLYFRTDNGHVLKKELNSSGQPEWVLVTDLTGFESAGVVQVEGTNWQAGNSDPLDDAGNVGDWWVNLESGEIFQKVGDREWLSVGSLKYSDVAAWLNGQGDPAATLGFDGNYYFDTLTGSIWYKTGGTWIKQIDLGVEGAGAFPWLIGDGNPNFNEFAELGAVGQNYFDSGEGQLYEKTRPWSGSATMPDTTSWEARIDITATTRVAINGNLLYGSNPPGPNDGTIVGQSYFDTNAGIFYELTERDQVNKVSTWIERFAIAGAVDAGLHTGEGVPDDMTPGELNALYLDTATGILYQLTAIAGEVKTWAQIFDLDAGTGAGNNWFVGDGVPNDPADPPENVEPRPLPNTREGDFYVNRLTQQVFYATADGNTVVWAPSFNIRGEAGEGTAGADARVRTERNEADTGVELISEQVDADGVVTRIGSAMLRDGQAPNVSVEQIAGGHRVTIGSETTVLPSAVA